MRWSSRVADLANCLVVARTSTPDVPVQRLYGSLSGSNPYTTRWDATGAAPATTSGQVLPKARSQSEQGSRSQPPGTAQHDHQTARAILTVRPELSAYVDWAPLPFYADKIRNAGLPRRSSPVSPTCSEGPGTVEFSLGTGVHHHRYGQTVYLTIVNLSVSERS